MLSCLEIYILEHTLRLSEYPSTKEIFCQVTLRSVLFAIINSNGEKNTKRQVQSYERRVIFRYYPPSSSLGGLYRADKCKKEPSNPLNCGKRKTSSPGTHSFLWTAGTWENYPSPFGCKRNANPDESN